MSARAQNEKRSGAGKEQGKLVAVHEKHPVDRDHQEV
jgi:hypothetical protein